MALILLVSSLQFSVYKMECLMSGKTQISLSDFEDCNQNPDDCSISEKCCAFSSLTFDFDFDSNIEAESQNPVNPIAVAPQPIFSSFERVFPKNECNFYTNLPPPSGFELLKVVQVFRI